jgi:hypothetical protein
MLKKILVTISIAWAVFITICAVTWLKYAHLLPNQLNVVQAAQSDQFINGFPYDPGWKDGKITPPFLTRDQLVNRDDVQALEDKAEITNLLYAYGYYHDTGNGPGIISTFTKDGAIGGGYNNNGAEIDGDGCMTSGDEIWDAGVDASGKIAHWPDKTIPRPYPGHSHNVITNVMIQLHGDTAELHAYYTRIHSNMAGEPPIAEAPHTAAVDHTGEYIMDLKRTPGGWRFTRQWHVGDAPPSGTRPARQCKPVAGGM